MKSTMNEICNSVHALSLYIAGDKVISWLMLLHSVHALSLYISAVSFLSALIFTVTAKFIWRHNNVQSKGRVTIRVMELHDLMKPIGVDRM